MLDKLHPRSHVGEKPAASARAGALKKSDCESAYRHSDCPAAENVAAPGAEDQNGKNRVLGAYRIALDHVAMKRRAELRRPALHVEVHIVNPEAPSKSKNPFEIAYQIEPGSR